MEQESKMSILIKAFFSRIANIISSPEKEWQVIMSENPSRTSLIVYALILSLIPFLSLFIKYAFIGTDGYPEGNPVVGLEYGLYYFLSLILLVYFLAWFVDFRATAFNSDKNFTRSLQLVVYSFTPYWVACLLFIFGVEKASIIQIIGLYSIYMIYMGLPSIKGTKSNRIVGYIINIAIAMIVLRMLFGYLAQYILDL